jgi:uncharacterized protein
MLYIDSSALVKLYVPENESDSVDEFLQGRNDLMISELVITEVISAVARRKREGLLTAVKANKIRDALVLDADSGSFRRMDLDPSIHRAAERLLLSTATPLRTLDALHLALAFGGAATQILTFDVRMRDAAIQAGLDAVDP